MVGAHSVTEGGLVRLDMSTPRGSIERDKLWIAGQIMHGNTLAQNATRNRLTRIAAAGTLRRLRATRNKLRSDESFMLRHLFSPATPLMVFTSSLNALGRLP